MKICHVPNMGPARGIYSDLLLHDMGYESIDLNLAEPYRVAATPIILENKITSTTLQSINYYGRTSTISSRQSTGPRTNSRSKSRRRSPPEHFNFVAPTHPAPFNIVDLGSRTTFSTTNETKKEEVTTSRRSGTASTTTTQRTRKTEQLLMKVHYEQTNLKQEWRTPPLWGVRDSAPYMHDGRAETLLESIAMHDGESAGTRDRFLNLPLADRHAVIAFLETLVAPPGVPQPAL